MWNPFKTDPIDEELRFHAEQLKQERMEAGDTAEQATQYARRKLGSTLRIEETVRLGQVEHCQCTLTPPYKHSANI